jgi:hypothetical protein
MNAVNKLINFQLQAAIVKIKYFKIKIKLWLSQGSLQGQKLKHLWKNKMMNRGPNKSR